MREIPRIGKDSNAEEASGMLDSVSPLGLGELDSEHGVVLKDWSAQDFARIYVRFLPHLISHARKFLREESQAEEVVQDAFLYLMTALPELDSELGVLRFLKWKTKMLCLDILRSSSSGLNASLVPLPEDVADEAQLESSLERADDAAIIQMALAKLNPRHREALIATLYEEKSHEDVASEMGLGPNAFRQLLFRARASFKSALIGEAEVKGKSSSELLSIAARKHSKSLRSSGLISGVLAIFIWLSVGFQPAMQVADDSESISAMAPNEVKRSNDLAPLSSESFSYPDVQRGVDDTQKDAAPVAETASIIGRTDNSIPTVSQSPSAASQIDPASVTSEEAVFLLDLAIESAMAPSDTKLVGGTKVRPGILELTFDSLRGLRSSLVFDSGALDAGVALTFEIELPDRELVALVPREVQLLQLKEGQQKKFVVVATDFVAGELRTDGTGIASDELKFTQKVVELSFEIDDSGAPLNAQLRIVTES